MKVSWGLQHATGEPVCSGAAADTRDADSARAKCDGTGSSDCSCGYGMERIVSYLPVSSNMNVNRELEGNVQRAIEFVCSTSSLQVPSYAVAGS